MIVYGRDDDQRKITDDMMALFKSIRDALERFEGVEITIDYGKWPIIDVNTGYAYLGWDDIDGLLQRERSLSLLSIHRNVGGLGLMFTVAI